ncbi:MAG: hypothetical protein AVDCRST_MAG11-1254, partial [uncultured Gemmatimonadaceae bacterium]
APRGPEAPRAGAAVRRLRPPHPAPGVRADLGGRGRVARGERAEHRDHQPQRVVGPRVDAVPVARPVPPGRLRDHAGRPARAVPVLPPHRVLRDHRRYAVRRAAGERVRRARAVGGRGAHALALPAGRPAAGARAAALPLGHGTAGAHARAAADRAGGGAVRVPRRAAPGVRDPRGRGHHRRARRAHRRPLAPARGAAARRARGARRGARRAHARRLHAGARRARLGERAVRPDVRPAGSGAAHPDHPPARAGAPPRPPRSRHDAQRPAPDERAADRV